jgi:hypothetical protein
MKKRVVFALIVLLCVGLIAPAVAFAQELLARSEILPPLALVTFGFLGLIGGAAGYVWRVRKGYEQRNS